MLNFLFQEAKEFLATGEVEEISFDNDLGLDSEQGYQIADWLEEKIFLGEIPAPKLTSIHSANPVAAERLKMTLPRFSTLT